MNQSTHSRVANSTASRRAPRAAPMDHLGLEQAVDRFGEGVVVAIADAADRGLDARLGEPLGVAIETYCDAAIAVMDEAAALDGPAVVERLLQRIEHEAGVGRARHPPADDAPGKGVDDEGDVDEARPGRDIGEVATPTARSAAAPGTAG